MCKRHSYTKISNQFRGRWPLSGPPDSERAHWAFSEMRRQKETFFGWYIFFGGEMKPTHQLQAKNGKFFFGQFCLQKAIFAIYIVQKLLHLLKYFYAFDTQLFNKLLMGDSPILLPHNYP